MDKRTRIYRDIRLVSCGLVCVLLGAYLNKYQTYRSQPSWADKQLKFVTTALASPISNEELSSLMYVPPTERIAVWTEVKEVVVPTTAQIIEKYSQMYNVPQALVHCIIKSESGYNPKAKNAHSSASGIAQFITSTWIANRKYMKLDPNPDLRFDQEEAIHTMVWMLSRGQKHQWEVYLQGKCNL
jgi:soluble lytic murein transglycosylase-like protein